MPKLKKKKDWSSIINKMKDQNSGSGNFKDERIYQPEFKDDGTAKAVIRFLEAPDVDLPIVKTYSHYFRGVGGWYVDLCPTTIGGECPVCEDNTKHWNAGKEDFVRKRRSSRTLHYYANILVVEDKKNPENEGKVFLYKFGKKIYEKFEDAMNEGFVPWDEDAGCNFNLKIKKVKVGKDTMPNYDGAHFIESETALSEYGDVEKINSSLYNLAEFCDKSKFKSYADLTEKLNKALGATNTPAPVAEEAATETQVPAENETAKSEAEEPIEQKEVFEQGSDLDFFDNMD